MIAIALAKRAAYPALSFASLVQLPYVRDLHAPVLGFARNPKPTSSGFGHQMDAWAEFRLVQL
jgi:hypothetical protein